MSTAYGTGRVVVLECQSHRRHCHAHSAVRAPCFVSQAEFRCAFRSRAKRVYAERHHHHHEHEHTSSYKPIADADAYGPRGLLIVGFKEDEAAKLEAWFQGMEPGFSIACATDEMMERTLGETLWGPGGEGEKRPMRAVPWQPSDTISPRVALFSGLSGQEQVALAEAWGEFSGVPVPIFAAAVPSTMNTTTAKVLNEIVTEAVHFESQQDEASPSEPEVQLQPVDKGKLKRVLAKKANARAAGGGSVGGAPSPQQAATSKGFGPGAAS